MRTEEEARYAPAAVAHLTGVSAHVLRAWERRYGAVEPQRTPGGARRYSEREVARLRLLRQAVDAGHPIGDVASLSDSELRQLVGPSPEPAAPATSPDTIEALLDAARGLEVDVLESSLSHQLATLGPRGFARDVATPLLRRIGEEWERGELSVSAEHAATAILRSLVGGALRRDSLALRGPTILFATPAGERHEVGTLIAALEALAVGVRAVFLGADLPVAELAAAARAMDARAVALGIAGLENETAEEEVRALRRALPGDVTILLGGAGAAEVAAMAGVETVHRLEDLESHVSRINA